MAMPAVPEHPRRSRTQPGREMTALLSSLPDPMSSMTAGQTSEGPRAMPSSTPKLLVISPAKDEACYLPRTIATVAAQTHRPALWVIVDDGSTDDTAEIAEEAARVHPWIRVLRRPSGTRRVGPGVIEAFYAGLAHAGGLDGFDYICKLD